MRLQQRTVIVLGATAGLAQSTLAWLAQEGAHLVLHSRDEQRLQDCLSHLSCPSSRIATVLGDITDATLGERCWEASQTLSGEPFGLLCFVGTPGRLTPEDWTPQALAELFAINCSGPLLACRTWAHHMQKAGYTGNAVLLSTMQANYPFEGSLPYTLGKTALQAGIQLLAKEHGGAPALRINGIAPGVNQAGMALASIQRGKYQPYLDQQTIPRYGQPDDLQHAIAFLLQPDLYMTGQILLMDGGLTLRRDLLK